jgi:putative ABC transport system permease protein
MRNSSGEARTLVVGYGLSRADLRRVEAAFEDEAIVVPLKAVGGEVRRHGERTISQVFGTTPAFREVANLRIAARGRYITQEDLEQGNQIAVIGDQVARQFFRLEDPIGATIRIDEIVFTIVGVFDPIGFAGGAGAAQLDRDLNRDIHIPITTARERYGDLLVRRESGSFSGEEIYIKTGSTDAVVLAADRIKRLATVEHPRMRDVELIVPWELLENAKRAMLVWNIMLVVIAAISLLVGGIGIMNIMLASITERTREIGIRRALGATRRDIVMQFLIETGSLSALGGLLGIALGIGVSVAFEQLIPWVLSFSFFDDVIDSTITIKPVVTMWSIVVSFIVAAGVGLVFGIYPAVVASRKDPIEALRHD